jgi:hypothetical protein
MKMNTLKGWITTTGLALVLTFGATLANAGITIPNAREGSTGKTEQTCTDTKENVDYGITIPNLTGFIIATFTGITIINAADVPVNCGITIPN